MRFSIWPSPVRPWDEILELTRHCEETGWDGVYFADHFMPNAPDATPLDGDTLECWSIIAALAATVPRLRLAPLVTSVSYRHPAVLANIAAAVDNISGGRLLLGIGAGWQENEHAAYGIELGSVKERLDRFEEATQILISLLRETRTTFNGRFFHIDDAPNQPPPVQPRLPLLIGGSGEKRTMRIAARYADEWNAWTTPDVLAHKVGVLGHDLFLYPELSAHENLAFFAGLYHCADPSAVATSALAQAGLADRARDPVHSFSRGMRQRVALERALIHAPRLALLDEPFTGLDDASAAALVGRLSSLREAGTIVILATHDLELAEGLLDQAVFLRDGRVASVLARPEQLRSTYRDVMARS